MGLVIGGANPLAATPAAPYTPAATVVTVLERSSADATVPPCWLMSETVPLAFVMATLNAPFPVPRLTKYTQDTGPAFGHVTVHESARQAARAV